MTGIRKPEDGGQACSDTTVPNLARMWDYYLGGSDNRDADRKAARLLLGSAPDVPLSALENREFLKHAVQFLAKEARLRQFIDIGSGLPTQSNVHELAQRHDPAARVVYVDNDPAVVRRGLMHLGDIPGATLICRDLREPDAIIGDQDLCNLIDFSQPVALCITLVLHFIPNTEDPLAIVARFRDALPSGSYLVISHVTSDGRDKDTVARITDACKGISSPHIPRSRAEIAQFFNGFELIEPGIVFLSQWRPISSHYAGGGRRWAYAGVGYKSPPVGPELDP